MTEIAPHEWEELQKIVRNAAKEAVRKWPGVIDSDDVEQDVFLILAESPGTVRTILEADPPIRHRMALKLCHREASKEMTDYEHFSGQYTYDTDMVRALLENGALTKDLQGFREEIIDLIDALQRMTWEKSVYVDPILKRYVDGDIPVRLSAELKQLSRGVESLTEHMNRNMRTRVAARSGGPGSRRVMSNAYSAIVVRRTEVGA